MLVIIIILFPFQILFSCHLALWNYKSTRFHSGNWNDKFQNDLKIFRDDLRETENSHFPLHCFLVVSNFTVPIWLDSSFVNSLKEPCKQVYDWGTVDHTEKLLWIKFLEIAINSLAPFAYLVNMNFIPFLTQFKNKNIFRKCWSNDIIWFALLYLKRIFSVWNNHWKLWIESALKELRFFLQHMVHSFQRNGF